MKLLTVGAELPCSTGSVDVEDREALTCLAPWKNVAYDFAPQPPSRRLCGPGDLNEPNYWPQGSITRVLKICQICEEAAKLRGVRPFATRPVGLESEWADAAAMA
jgi:hypothetical protein